MWADELLKNEPSCVVFVVGTKRLYLTTPSQPKKLKGNEEQHKQTNKRTVDLVESGQFPRAVTEHNVRAFAQQLNVQECNVFDTSAQSGKGVKELFEAVAKYYKPKEGRTDTRVLAPENEGASWCNC